jgi:predicted RNA-binding Zn ribbon-like protein
VPVSPRQQQQSFREGAGRLCLDFTRTLRYRGQPRAEEELDRPESLARWIAQFGRCPRSPLRPTPSQVCAAQVLREAVHEIITAARGPRAASGAPDAARRTVNEAAARPVPVPQLHPGGQVSYGADDPVAATLALVARDCLELLGSPDLARIQACANPECRVLFVDRSRPGTRRWCSMETCGNRAKKAAQRTG